MDRLMRSAIALAVLAALFCLIIIFGAVPAAEKQLEQRPQDMTMTLR